MKHVWLLAALLMGAGCGDTRAPGDGGFVVGRDGAASTSDGGLSSGDAGPSARGGIGDPCTSDEQCTDPPEAECFTRFENPFTMEVVEEFPNGFCSRGCEESSECGSGEDVGCASLSTSGGGGSSSLMFCTVSCDGPSDCRADEGYQCQMIFGFGFCAPP